MSNKANFLHFRPSQFFSVCIHAVLFSLFVLPAISQNLPGKIRGYKVQKTEIVIANNKAGGEVQAEADAFVKFGEPEITDVSLTGITLAVPAEIQAVAQSGKVEFLTFHDFRVNGMPVEIEEFAQPFSFGKGETIVLPKPATIFLPTHGIIKTAWNEIRNSKKEWTVTGRVFVFGKFRKMGFYFKRVVPVEIDIVIKNPLLEKPA